MHIDGACQCEKITYEAVVDPRDVTICHCTGLPEIDGNRLQGDCQHPTQPFSYNFRGAQALRQDRQQRPQEAPVLLC